MHASQHSTQQDHKMPPKSAFDELMRAAAATKKRSRSTSPRASSSMHKARSFPGHDALELATRAPEQLSDHVRIYYDDEVVVICDKYPKSQIHWLMLPRTTPRIAHVGELQQKHVPLLTKMRERAQELLQKHHPGAIVVANDTSNSTSIIHDTFNQTSTADMPSSDPSTINANKPSPYRPHVNLGFHALPSMHPLHLHIISDDFHATALKTRRHWNSFTAPAFMIPLAHVIARLEEGAAVLTESAEYYEAVLKRPLVCCHCGRDMASMPALKRHLELRFEGGQRKCSHEITK